MRSRKPGARSKRETGAQSVRFPRLPSPFWLLACGFWLLLPALPGCAVNRAQRDAEPAIAGYHVGNYGSAQKKLSPLSGKTDENFVLNNLRLGSVALANYDLDAAEGAFL